jgi:phage tail sheath protein FI
MVDPIRRGPAAVRETYPGGAIAGAYIRTDSERGVGKTPAGYSTDVRGALGVSAKITDATLSYLYDSGVNFLKAVAGAGVVVLGGRTLERSRPDKFISIRRSLNFIKQGVNDIAQDTLFEPNDPNLWNALSSRVDQFLTTFWGRGGLKGNTARDAYYVICNATNNTANDQEDGVVNIEIGVALQYPAEFIVVNISQWTGGSNTAETLPTDL